MIVLKYDQEVSIAVADTRLAKKWKNRKTKWSKIVNKCAQTTRTYETAAQYARMSKERQSDIKDVGGFVGGYLKDGVRKKGNVEFRSIVCLDVDYGELKMWVTLCSILPNAAFCYTTHKHSEDNNRFRFVILLQRPVKPWEYEAVGRWIAAQLGIDKFDDTTYEPVRLMYWPSTSKDAPYFFDYQDGPALNPDEILAKYVNPADASEWPTSSREGDVVRRSIRKAGDPTEKDGVVGAFCRAYSIEDAIDTFLSDVYEPTAMPNRYTYKPGSVAGGLVLYDGKFAYSHHDTDPCSRQLCNAFDLVRLHRFAHLDEDSNATEITRKPSYIAMCDFAAKDKKTKRVMAEETAKSVEDDFGHVLSEEAKDNSGWMDKLSYTGKGNNRKLEQTIENARLIIEGDPNLKGKLYLNEFTGAFEVRGRLPWARSGARWTDMDDSNLRHYLEKYYQISGKERIFDATNAVFTAHRRHPIKVYLDSLTWDGVPRLERLISDYLGADDIPIVRAFIRLHLVAAVSRIYEPGCKYDHCLILYGPEGTGKSSILSVLGGEWFNDSFSTLEGKEGMEQLRSGWIHELSELSSLKRSDVENIKAFISRRTDTYRAPYGRRVEEHPRQCVLAGTTNEEFFMKGDTGNRRFLPIQVKPDLRKFKSVSAAMADLQTKRDQIWAEAKHYYEQGESLYLPHDLEMEARRLQEICNDSNDDPISAQLDEFLEMPLPTNWGIMTLEERRRWITDAATDETMPAGVEPRTRFCAMEFVCEWMRRDRSGDIKYLCRKIAGLMARKPEWKPTSTTKHARRLYGIQRGFVRVGSNGAAI